MQDQASPDKEIINVQRMALSSIVLLCGLFCLTVQAQERAETPSQKVPCSHATSITRDNAGATDDRGAWTTTTSTQDGLLSLTYCGVFKSGQTTVNRLAVKELYELPAAGFDLHRKYAEMVGEKIQVRNLPPGFTVYKEMAFEIRTEAVPNMQYLTLRVPTVQSEEEFSKLVVLYLDEGSLTPGALRWQKASAGLDIPQADFKTRTLSAEFDFATVFNHATNIGRVVVASFNQAEYDKAAVDLYIRSVVGPPYVKVGETFTYSVTIVNGGANTIPATDVFFFSNMGNGAYVSVNSTQGRCRKSVNSDPDTVCDLGTVEAGKRVVISITVKAERSGMMDYHGDEVFTTRNFVYGREKDYTPENNSYDSRGTLIRP